MIALLAAMFRLKGLALEEALVAQHRAWASGVPFGMPCFDQACGSHLPVSAPMVWLKPIRRCCSKLSFV